MFGDLLSNALGQLIGEVLGESLEHKLDRRLMLREVEGAVRRAEARFAREYVARDAELAAALAQQTRFADLPSVRAALRALLTRPFDDPAASVAVVQRSFGDVLPEHVDRARVDAAVRAFLAYLGQEVLYIPQLRETYALLFQKISAESGRGAVAQAAALVQSVQGLRNDVRQLAASSPGALPAPPPQAPTRPLPWHNLPQRGYAQFVGRQAELERLRQLMRPHPHSRHFVVTIDGVGGVGKSALALELAHAYREHYAAIAPGERFELIVWVSAKRTLLTAGGIQQRRQTFNTLDDLYRAIATVCDQPAILQADAGQRRELIERVLATRRTLLLIDNLETVDDEELLTFLRELPDPTKAIITTRHRIDIAYAVRLTGMPHADALALVAQEAAGKGVALPPSAPAELVRRTGGLPLALVWSIGLMSVGHGVDAVLRRLGSGSSDIARFCFAESAARVQGRAPEPLLLALALFERSVSRAMLGAVAGLDDDPLARDDGLAELVQLSLVNQQGDRFDLLPLTQRFALDLLARQPELEDELRARWIALLTDLAEPYGGLHWRWRDRPWLYAEGKHIASLADWAERNERLDVLLPLVPALCYYYDVTGDWPELLRVGGVAVDYARLVDAIEAMVFIEHFMGWVLSHQGRSEEAEQHNLDALRLTRQLGDPAWICSALQSHSQGLRRRGDLKAAEAICHEALSLLGQLPEDQQPYVRADIDYELGKIARDRGDWEGAHTFFAAAQRIFRIDDEGPAFNVEFAWGLLSNLGEVAYRRGDHDTALRYYLQCLDTYRATVGKGDIATLLVRLATLEAAQGDHGGALLHAREALDLSRRLGMVQERQQAEALLARLLDG